MPGPLDYALIALIGVVIIPAGLVAWLRRRRGGTAAPGAGGTPSPARCERVAVRLVLVIGGAFALHSVLQQAERCVPTLERGAWEGLIAPGDVAIRASGSAWLSAARWRSSSPTAWPAPDRITFRRGDRSVTAVRAAERRGWIIEGSRAAASGTSIATALDAEACAEAMDAMLTLGWSDGTLADVADRLRARGDAAVPQVTHYEGDDRSGPVVGAAVHVIIIPVVLGAVWLLVLRPGRPPSSA